MRIQKCKKSFRINNAEVFCIIDAKVLAQWREIWFFLFLINDFLTSMMRIHRSKILLQKMQIKFSKHKNHENYHQHNCKESIGKNLVAANKFLFSFPLIPCWAFHEYFIRSMWIINIFVWIEFHFTIILFEYHRETWKCSFSQFYFALFILCACWWCANWKYIKNLRKELVWW